MCISLSQYMVKNGQHAVVQGRKDGLSRTLLLRTQLNLPISPEQRGGGRGGREEEEEKERRKGEKLGTALPSDAPP